jgi:hypothetical protein
MGYQRALQELRRFDNPDADGTHPMRALLLMGGGSAGERRAGVRPDALPEGLSEADGGQHDTFAREARMVAQVASEAVDEPDVIARRPEIIDVIAGLAGRGGLGDLFDSGQDPDAFVTALAAGLRPYAEAPLEDPEIVENLAILASALQGRLAEGRQSLHSQVFLGGHSAKRMPLSEVLVEAGREPGLSDALVASLPHDDALWEIIDRTVMLTQAGDMGALPRLRTAWKEALDGATVGRDGISGLSPEDARGIAQDLSSLLSGEAFLVRHLGPLAQEGSLDWRLTLNARLGDIASRHSAARRVEEGLQEMASVSQGLGGNATPLEACLGVFRYGSEPGWVRVGPPPSGVRALDDLITRFWALLGEDGDGAQEFFADWGHELRLMPADESLGEAPEVLAAMSEDLDRRRSGFDPLPFHRRGLNARRRALLACLSSRSDATLPEMSRAMGVPVPHLARLLPSLVRQGVVVRVKSASVLTAYRIATDVPPPSPDRGPLGSSWDADLLPEARSGVRGHVVEGGLL